MVADPGVGVSENFREDPMGPINLIGVPRAQASFKEHGHHAASMFGIPRVQRGHLVQARRMKRVSESGSGTRTELQRLALRFMFNPAELTLSWTIRDDLFQAGSIPGDSVAAFGTEAASFNLTLLFDRTYEVYQGDRRPSSHTVGTVGSTGVQEDVWQFEKLIGLRDGPAGGGGTQPLRQVPLLFFPNADTSDSAATQTDSEGNLQYNGAWQPILGYINTASVTYTQFAWNMTPIRAVISIGFLRYYTGPNQGLTSVPTVGSGISGSFTPVPVGNTSPDNGNSGAGGPQEFN